MSELYENLLKATDNTNDITNEKYGTVVKIDGALCSVLEEDTNLEHTNVPVLNQIYLETGDKVVLGFVSNSIYNPIIVGNLTRGIRLSADDIIEPSSLNNLGLPANSSQHQINLKVNEKINQGGGGSDVDIVTSWEPTPSDTKVPSEKLTKNTLDNKVDKSSTTGLLKNDGSVDTTAYSTFDGNYNSLTNKPTIPTIPTNVSAFTNDVGYLTQHQSLANYIEKSSTSGLIKNDGSVDTTSYLSSLPSHTHDDRYYTESEMDTALNNKQDTLVSGTSIKTINNTSLLGSGNINIQGGGTVTVDDSLSTTSTNAVQNKVITGALNGKANSSHTHISSDVTDLIDTIYPIGSIYMSVNSVNPSTLFGGTWEQIKDTFLLSSGDTYSNGTTGGSATVSLSASQMPRHNHSTNAHSHSTNTTGEYFVTSESGSANNTRVSYNASGNRYVDGMTSNSTPFHHRSDTSNASPTTKYTGGTGSTEAYSNGSAHENMPPYLAVNVWKRTA